MKQFYKVKWKKNPVVLCWTDCAVIKIVAAEKMNQTPFITRSDCKNPFLIWHFYIDSQRGLAESKNRGARSYTHKKLIRYTAHFVSIIPTLVNVSLNNYLMSFTKLQKEKKIYKLWYNFRIMFLNIKLLRP